MLKRSLELEADGKMAFSANLSDDFLALSFMMGDEVRRIEKKKGGGLSKIVFDANSKKCSEAIGTLVELSVGESISKQHAIEAIWDAIGGSLSYYGISRTEAEEMFAFFLNGRNLRRDSMNKTFEAEAGKWMD